MTSILGAGCIDFETLASSKKTSKEKQERGEGEEADREDEAEKEEEEKEEEKEEEQEEDEGRERIRLHEAYSVKGGCPKGQYPSWQYCKEILQCFASESLR